MDQKVKPSFVPLGYDKPSGIPKDPDFTYHAKPRRGDPFKSDAFIVGDSIFFRCNYTLEKTGTNTETGEIQHWWRVRNTWFALHHFLESTISEATAMSFPYFPHPHSADMMIPLLKRLGLKYWPGNILRNPTPAQPKAVRYVQADLF